MVKALNNKPYPIRHYVKIMLFISIFALVVDLVISFASIFIVKQQSTRYLQDTANLYIRQINHDFSYINHYMGWTLANDESVKIMDTPGTDYVDYIKSSERVHKRFNELQKNYGQEYNFFFYLKEQDFFQNYAPMSLSYTEFQELKEQIVSLTDSKNVYETFYSNWNPILVQDTHYVINIVPYHNRYLICLISADDLVRPLQELDLGEDGFVSLVDAQGAALTSPSTGKAGAKPLEGAKASLFSLSQPRTTVTEGFSNASFNVQLVIQFGVFETIMIAQLLIMLLFVLLTCTLSVVMLYFKKKVLKPIQNFSENVRRIHEDSENLDFMSSEIIELEQVNSQFKHLIEQIKKFKIDIYEQELEKQRIQLDYMKLQINPHFFLNCLTNIYSMAQMQMFKEIEYMSLSTSKYFRYIFQSGDNLVRLEDEIEHVRIYLEIQKHRYRDAFSYHIGFEQELAGLTIPPLVLQTFIENAVKYAVSRDQVLQIRLTVSLRVEDDKPYAVIRISDTGPGFPEDVLDKLANGKPLDQSEGKHIGIMNTLQRLELLYHHRAQVEFSNPEGGGASVALTLPQPLQERRGDIQ
ncbi:histidine kinase [Paenibacillus lautus]|uniref:Sensor histidine kinase n=1 Tax=Paenibacillus lautus TaxID=1401 RepID=A0A385TRJ9_PAELA|nr:histidine kinase [Paenibacillus lautus]AYB45364.1 sensor histidine kinase [Paenibacillus lautus]